MTKKMAKKVSFGKSFKNCIRDYEYLLETALVIFRITDIFTDLVGALFFYLMMIMYFSISYLIQAC